MRNQPHAVILGVLTAIGLAGIIVLYAIGRPVPDVLSTVTVVGLSALAGLAVPAALTTRLAAVTPPATVAAPAPPAAPPVGVPATVGVAHSAAREAPSSPLLAETAPAGTVAPGMSPVQARIAGGS